MRAEIITAGVIVAAAIVGVRFIDNSVDGQENMPVYDDAAGGHDQRDATLSAIAPNKEDLAQYYAARPREVHVKPGPHNQYFLDVTVNNRRPLAFLVDTGASFVALRQSDAAGAGVRVSPDDFSQPVRTANGETRAAVVKLDRIMISDISVNNVEAFILPDDQLGVNLLGMSFLSRLESVEARNGELVLRG